MTSSICSAIVISTRSFTRSAPTCISCTTISSLSTRRANSTARDPTYKSVCSECSCCTSRCSYSLLLLVLVLVFRARVYIFIFFTSQATIQTIYARDELSGMCYRRYAVQPTVGSNVLSERNQSAVSRVGVVFNALVCVCTQESIVLFVVFDLLCCVVHHRSINFISVAASNTFSQFHSIPFTSLFMSHLVSHRKFLTRPTANTIREVKTFM